MMIVMPKNDIGQTLRYVGTWHLMMLPPPDVLPLKRAIVSFERG
jgi:hypothetical protein